VLVRVAIALVPRRERSDVDRLSHGVVAGVVRVEVIPWQQRELAVRQEHRFHVAGGRVERGQVELLHPSKVPESARPNQCQTLLLIRESEIALCAGHLGAVRSGRFRVKAEEADTLLWQLFDRPGAPPSLQIKLPRRRVSRRKRGNPPAGLSPDGGARP